MSKNKISEAVQTFSTKYNFKDIWAVGMDEELGVIHVYTSNAKIWVDLPNTHEGFFVKMNVGRAPKPSQVAPTSV
jgi:hypothetical protein